MAMTTEIYVIRAGCSPRLCSEPSHGSGRRPLCHIEHARAKGWRTVLWRRCLSLLPCVALALACTACSAVVYTKQPAGDRPVRLDRSLWEGIWIPRYEGAGASSPRVFSSERRLVRPIYIKVADADKGILRVSWVEGRDGDFKLAGSDVYVRRQGRWLLVSLPWPGGDGYWWARVEIFPTEKDWRDGGLVIWAPSGAALQKPIRDGIVPGRMWTDGSLVEIDPEGIAWIESTEDSTGTLWMVPTIYKRIKLDSFEPPAQRKLEQRSPPAEDAPK